jgi:hypothetical protein
MYRDFWIRNLLQNNLGDQEVDTLRWTLGRLVARANEAFGAGSGLPLVLTMLKLQVWFIPETTQQISIKYGIGNLQWKLSGECNSGPCLSNINADFRRNPNQTLKVSLWTPSTDNVCTTQNINLIMIYSCLQHNKKTRWHNNPQTTT